MNITVELTDAQASALLAFAERLAVTPCMPPSAVDQWVLEDDLRDRISSIPGETASRDLWELQGAMGQIASLVRLGRSPVMTEGELRQLIAPEPEGRLHVAADQPAPQS